MLVRIAAALLPLFAAGFLAPSAPAAVKDDIYLCKNIGRAMAEFAATIGYGNCDNWC